jgi:hypothetical protein
MTTSQVDSIKTTREFGKRVMSGGRFLAFMNTLKTTNPSTQEGDNTMSTFNGSRSVQDIQRPRAPRRRISRSWGWSILIALAMLVFIAPVRPASAGTEIFSGIITYVDLEAKGKIDGKGDDKLPSAHCIIWLIWDSNNGDFVSDGRFMRYPLPDDSVIRHQYFLDGKKCTRAEAVKVGHFVNWTRATTPGIWFEAWSRFNPKEYANPWRFPDADANPGQAIWTLSLSPGIAVPCWGLKAEKTNMNESCYDCSREIPDKSTCRETQWSTGDLFLKLVTENGRVTRGYAKVGCVSGSFFHHYFTTDVSGLALQGRRLTGKISINLLVFAREQACFFFPDSAGKLMRQTTVTLEIDAHLDEKGVVTGTYSGDVLPARSKPSILGCATKPAVIREPRRAVIRAGHQILGFDLRDGVLDPKGRTYIYPYGGKPTLEVGQATGTLRDGVLKAELTPPEGSWCKRVVMEGCLIDDEVCGISEHEFAAGKTIASPPSHVSYKNDPILWRKGGFLGRLQFLDEPYQAAVPAPGKVDGRDPKSPGEYLWSSVNNYCNFSALFFDKYPPLTVGGRPVFIEGKTGLEKFHPPSSR